MDTLIKYEEKNSSSFQNLAHYHRSHKYHLSHEKFIVPWQMDNEKHVKEKEK